MQSVKVIVVLPTTRKSGRPLPIEQIDSYRLEISADGANFVPYDTFTPDALENVVPDLEPGTWSFKGVVIDTALRESAGVVASITVEDNSPPGELTITLSLAA